MGSRNISTEFCSIRFETELINSSDLVQTSSKTSVRELSAIRLVKDGRLGVAVSTSPTNLDLQKYAEESSKYGPKVPNDFLHFPNPSLQPKLSDREQLFRLWILEVNNTLKHYGYEYKFVVKKVNRTLQLIVDADRFLHTNHLYFQIIIRLRNKNGSQEIVLKKSVINNFPDPKQWLIIYPWHFDTFGGIKIQSGTYEVVFSPETFHFLLNLLLHNFSAELYPVKSLIISREKIGKKIFSSELNIDQSSGFDICCDDEGTPISKQPLVRDGVLIGYYNDRFLSVKHNIMPSGNGFRTLAPNIELKDGVPSPRYPFAWIKSGKNKLTDVIENMRDGIIIEKLSHSHNPDFLLSPVRIPIHEAWCVKNGKIIGKIIGHPILSINLGDFFANLIIASNTTFNVEGKMLPWVYSYVFILTQF